MKNSSQFSHGFMQFLFCNQIIVNFEKYCFSCVRVKSFKLLNLKFGKKRNFSCVIKLIEATDLQWLLFPVKPMLKVEVLLLSAELR